MEVTCENVEELMRNVCEQYLPEQVIISHFGVILKINEKYHRTDFNGNNSIETINKLIKEIPKYFQKHSSFGKKYWNTSSSYGCKHHLADEIKNDYDNTYCTNGQFIFAMLLLGYEMKRIELHKLSPRLSKDENGNKIYDICPNVTFNCSFRDLSKVVCPCGIQYTKQAKKQHERSKTHNLIMKAKE
tara:strand:- start:44 stop:604 length:561 start_codon:yes stop_codon:yes gene_type:complete